MLAAINPVAFTLFGKDVYWYGIIIAAALLLGIGFAGYRAKQRGHAPDIILDIALIVVPLAVIGARAYYVIFQWELYKDNLLEIFAIWNGGLAIYGALIGGFVGIVLAAKVKKIKMLELCDILAPSIVLGQAIGRWGNFVNQEAFGAVITNPAWQFFPAAVFIEADGMYHMATFFYESMWNVIVFVLTLIYDRKYKEHDDGNTFFLYIMLYGVGRAVIEGFRTDSLYVGGTSIRISQLLGIVLAVVFFIVLLRSHTLKRRKKLEDAEVAPELKLFEKQDSSQQAQEEQQEQSACPVGEDHDADTMPSEGGTANDAQNGHVEEKE